MSISYNQSNLTRQQAQRLFKRHREVCLPGSGIVRYNGHRDIKQNDYITIVICTTQEIVSKNVLQTITSKQIKVAIQFDQELCTNSALFFQYFDQILSGMLEVEKERTFIFVLNYQEKYSTEILKIVGYLQAREFSIFIQINHQRNTAKEYQQELSAFSYNVLENEGVLLQGISLILQIHQIQSQQISDSLISLLSIWKRTLPVGLGSLILKDWIDFNEKAVFKMHFLKDIKPFWELQFLTEIPERAENLGCQCIGID